MSSSIPPLSRIGFVAYLKWKMGELSVNTQTTTDVISNGGGNGEGRTEYEEER